MGDHYYIKLAANGIIGIRGKAAGASGYEKPHKARPRVSGQHCLTNYLDEAVIIDRRLEERCCHRTLHPVEMPGKSIDIPVRALENFKYSVPPMDHMIVKGQHHKGWIGNDTAIPA